MTLLELYSRMFTLETSVWMIDWSGIKKKNSHVELVKAVVQEGR